MCCTGDAPVCSQSAASSALRATRSSPPARTLISSCAVSARSTSRNHGGRQAARCQSDDRFERVRARLQGLAFQRSEGMGHGRYSVGCRLSAAAAALQANGYSSGYRQMARTRPRRRCFATPRSSRPSRRRDSRHKPTASSLKPLLIPSPAGTPSSGCSCSRRESASRPRPVRRDTASTGRPRRRPAARSRRPNRARVPTSGSSGPSSSRRRPRRPARTAVSPTGRSEKVTLAIARRRAWRRDRRRSRSVRSSTASSAAPRNRRAAARAAACRR